jgi:hypothetical protein
MFNSHFFNNQKLLFLLFAFGIATPTWSEIRTWSDSTGKHKVEAEFVELKDQKVTLRRKDGKAITIALEKLSEADRSFVRSQSKGKAASASANSKDIDRAGCQGICKAVGIAKRRRASQGLGCQGQ